MSLSRFLVSLMIATGLSLAVLPSPAAAAGCIGDDQQIRHDNIAACLDPANQADFPFIINVWKFSLSVVNIFAALVLIVIAFANILYPVQALEPYRIRQLLPSFIWGVILANASLLIVRAIVSVADLLMSEEGFKVTIKQMYETWGLIPANLPNGVIQAVKAFQDTPSGEPADLLFRLVAGTLLVYVPIISLAVLAFIFYLRFAIIFLMTAISPLAFGAIIFPVTRQYLSRWWDVLWKWTFGGVGSFLILRIAAQVTPQAGGAGQVGPGGTLGVAIIPYLISLGLVWLAVMTPFKLGGALATGWVNANKWLARTGYGATKGGFGLMANVTQTEGGKNLFSLARGENLTKEQYEKLSTWQKVGHSLKRAGAWTLISPFRTAANVRAIAPAWEARKAAYDKSLKKATQGTAAFGAVAGRAGAAEAGHATYNYLDDAPMDVTTYELDKGVDYIMNKTGKTREEALELINKFNNYSTDEIAAETAKHKLNIPEMMKAIHAYKGFMKGAQWLQRGTSEPWRLADIALQQTTGEERDMAIIRYREQGLAESRERVKRMRAGQEREAEFEATPDEIVETVFKQLSGNSHLKGLGETTLKNIVAGSIGPGNKLIPEHLTIQLNKQLDLARLKLTPDNQKAIDAKIEQAKRAMASKLSMLSTKPIDATIAAPVIANYMVKEVTEGRMSTEDLPAQLDRIISKSKGLLAKLGQYDGGLNLDQMPAKAKPILVRYAGQLEARYKLTPDSIKTVDDLRHRLQQDAAGAMKHKQDLASWQKTVAGNVVKNKTTDQTTYKANNRKAAQLLEKKLGIHSIASLTASELTKAGVELQGQQQILLAAKAAKNMGVPLPKIQAQLQQLAPNDSLLEAEVSKVTDITADTFIEDYLQGNLEMTDTLKQSTTQAVEKKQGLDDVLASFQKQVQEKTT